VNIIGFVKNVLAPELNHLYTAPPFKTKTGIDCGWFCREHAYHVHLVCSLLKIQSDIRLGEYAIHTPLIGSVVYLDLQGEGHAWNSIKRNLPVDTSMTFLHFAFGQGPQLGNTIANTGKNGAFEIVYTKDYETAKAYDGLYNTVFFVENSVLDRASDELLIDPFLFIHPPNINDPLNWTSLFGSDIYAKITLHCYNIAQRRVKSLQKSKTNNEAIEWIANSYPDATNILLQILGR